MRIGAYVRLGSTRMSRFADCQRTCSGVCAIFGSIEESPKWTNDRKSNPRYRRYKEQRRKRSPKPVGRRLDSSAGHKWKAMKRSGEDDKRRTTERRMRKRIAGSECSMDRDQRGMPWGDVVEEDVAAEFQRWGDGGAQYRQITQFPNIEEFDGE